MLPRQSLLQRLSLAWKSARLPWRKRVLIGTDLEGNLYWEAPNTRNPTSRYLQRFVEFKQQGSDLSDYAEREIPVQWLAWLRHTRHDPPTIQEIIEADKRREQIIARAKELDRKWEERKAELQQQELLRIEAQKAKEKPFEEEKEKQQQPKKKIEPEPLFSPHPTGQGDTFEPGAWQPSSRQRG
ncbi:uncharacterized protein VTP21DRAFT_2422 [Calcarisporiella thermophila]|uniref:uncharacterized protein n=1 Tax=Calcarisporiella thermophila TaxID=911321 RepID=UPI003743B686